MNFTNLTTNFTSKLQSTTPVSPLQDVMTLLNKVYPLSLSIVGTLGNLLIFIIYCKSPSLEKLSTSFYIRVQAISDTLAIYLGTLRYFILGVTGINIRDLSTFSCKALNYSILIVNFTSAWLLVFSSFDRLIFILSCNGLKILLKRYVQAIVASLLIASGFLIFLVRPLTIELKKGVCTDVDRFSNQVVNVLEPVFVVLLPFTCLTLSSLYLTFVLYKSKKKLFKKVHQTQSTTQQRTSIGELAATFEETIVSQKQENTKK